MNTKKTPNRHKVNSNLWKGFKTEEARQTFNAVYRSTLKDQQFVVHPKTKLPKEQWRTICWNFACIAAWAVRDGRKQD